jgi:hypothetical protein
MIYLTTADTTDREGAIEGIKNSSSFFPNVKTNLTGIKNLSG